MNSISGFSGFDPQAMMQRAQERMAAADTDGNGAVSFGEAEASVKENGGSGDMLNKMFEKADSNGDGELSQQEQDQMFSHMEDQMAKMKSMMSPTGGSGQGNFNSFKSLLDSLNQTEEDSTDNSNDSFNLIADRYKLENQTPVDIIA